MYEHFLSLVPEISRTKKSVISRWQEMTAKFKLLLYFQCPNNVDSFQASMLIESRALRGNRLGGPLM